MKNFFTLIELIVVIAVLGILAAIIIPNISSFQEEANTTAIVSNVRSLQTGVDMYSMENYGSIPTYGTPTEYEPKPVNFEIMHPKYTRDLPETEGVKYWVDGWGKVWASTVDAPENVDLVGTQLNWDTVPEADMYKVYKVLNPTNTSSLLNANTKLIFYKEASKDEYINFPVDDDTVQYAVSAVDNNKFESAPAGHSYRGYDNLVSLGSTLDISNMKGENCKDIKQKYPNAIDGNYKIKPDGYSGNEFEVYCDMTTDGGGWTMWYTTDQYYHIADSPINNTAYGVDGYSRDLRAVPFSEVMYVRHTDDAKDWFSRDNGSTLKVEDHIDINGVIHTSGSTFGLWSGHGEANTNYKYQLNIGDKTWMQIGLMMTGYTNCWKVTSNWCGDTTTNYYRINGEGNGTSDNNLYHGISFRENGHRNVSTKLMSVGVR